MSFKYTCQNKLYNTSFKSYYTMREYIILTIVTTQFSFEKIIFIKAVILYNVYYCTEKK